MKKLMLSGILLATITATHGQGVLVFANLASGVNAPVSLAATGERIRDPLFLADLYFSTKTNAPIETLQPAGFNVPFSTTSSGGGGGYFLGGIRTLTNVPGGTTILAQVRVWNSTNSPNWNPMYQEGHSTSFLVTLANPPAAAPSLIGLTSFEYGWMGDYDPIITTQPLTQNAASGDTARFGVRAVDPFFSPHTLQYQWSFNGISLPGATDSVLKLTNVQLTQKGAYQVRVSTILGYTFSSSADLGVVDTALEAPLVPALVISNGVGSNFVLRYSASVSPAPVWLNLASLTPTNNPQLYVDGSATNAPSRLYRLVQVP